MTINNEIYSSDNFTTTKHLKYYILIHLGLLALCNLLLIINAIILFNISKEVNHFMYHAFDCCHNLF